MTTPNPAYELANAAGRQLLAVWKRGRMVTLSVGVPGSKNTAIITMSDKQAAEMGRALAIEEAANEENPDTV